MKISISTEHSDFFRKHHAIEFEGLFSPEQIQQLKQFIEQTLIMRLEIRASQFPKTSTYQQFLAGRDLWRDNQGIKKILSHGPYLDALAALTDQRILRLGYDQYFPKVSSNPLEEETKYPQFIDKQVPIEAISSIQGIVGGAIICLEGSSEVSENNSPESPMKYFPSSSGHTLLFGSQANIDFRELLQHPTHSYLLVTLTKQTAVYVYNAVDPNTHTLRDIGYPVSDRLTDKLNPIVFRG